VRPRPIVPGPDQESVWDYPRPPAVEREPRAVEIVLGGVVLASTRAAVRVLETSHPPVYYIPRSDILDGALLSAAGGSFCEWKGQAVYFDVLGGGVRRDKAAWSYPDPTPLARSLRDHVAFYAGPMDLCTVGGEVVTPQPGGFYGGWVTSWITGPFKGGPGSWGW
jgi:uncharacterized protein (DUF427 family)